MTKQALQLQELAMKLPPAERYELLVALWESLGLQGEAELSAEELALIEQRLADHRANPQDTIPADEVFKRLRNRRPA
ncbi:MAG: addiction module protein [Planctomycetes bacterium]|nr:addiction module protein [Planctomycetota bacterium]